jgi:hypothetical protein
VWPCSPQDGVVTAPVAASHVPSGGDCCYRNESTLSAKVLADAGSAATLHSRTARSLAALASQVPSGAPAAWRFGHYSGRSDAPK